MSSEVIVSLRGVGKAYPKIEKPYHRLLHMVSPHRAEQAEFHALQDIDLDIHRGEAIGIIGRNGSGKSTLLQIIAGILQPTRGRLRVDARIAALLELGAGFNPEFTGRENIQLNAGLLGLSGAEIALRMDDIIAFAEIGEHLEQQVKTYSSGMFVRLAFAVAVHTDPEVLIVDEALAVGDVYFQRKCQKKIEELRQRGCTLLFVTHAVDSLLQLCDRGVVLDAGRLLFDGPSKDAVREYLKRVFGENSVHEPTGAEVAMQASETAEASDELAAFRAGGVADRFSSRPGYNRDESRMGDGRAVTCDYLVSGSHGYGPLVAAREPFTLHVRYHFPVALDRLLFGLRITTVTGTVVYSTHSFHTGHGFYACDAGTVAVVAFDMRCALIAGQYFVTVGVSRYDDDGLEIEALDRRASAIIIGVTAGPHRAEGTADLEAAISVEARSGALRFED